MVRASCLGSWKPRDVLTSARMTGHQRRRQPSRLHLFLEPLEDRVVPDVSGNVFGGIDNPTVNPALASAGIVLPVFPNGPQSGLILQPFFAGSPQDIAMGDRVDFLAQDQRVAQFRVLGVNSQGQGNEFGQEPWILFIYGFGSGTKPGQPWAPEYFSTDLANRPSLPFGPTVAYGPGQGGGPAAGNRGGGPVGGNPPAQPPGGGGGFRVPGDTNPRGDRSDQEPRNERPKQQEREREENRNQEQRPQERENEAERSKEPKTENQRPADQKIKDRPDGPKGVKESESGPMAQSVPSAEEASWFGEAGAVAAAVFAEPFLSEDAWLPLSFSSGEGVAFPTRLPAPLLSLEPAVELPAFDLGMDWGSGD